MKGIKIKNTKQISDKRMCLFLRLIIFLLDNSLKYSDFV